MLMLLFRIKDEPWALSVAEVKDLIPLVKLQPCAHLGENVVGILNYHGEHLPVADVSSIVACQRSPNAFSTRIAIVEIEDVESENSEREGEMESNELTEKVPVESCVVRLGLILDKAYETADLAKTVEIPFQTFADGFFIQSMLTNAEGAVVQQLALAPFLSKVRSASTLRETKLDKSPRALTPTPLPTLGEGLRTQVPLLPKLGEGVRG